MKRSTNQSSLAVSVYVFAVFVALAVSLCFLYPHIGNSIFPRLVFWFGFIMCAGSAVLSIFTFFYWLRVERRGGGKEKKEVSCANCKNRAYPDCYFLNGLKAFLVADFGEFGETILPALLKAAAENCKPGIGCYHYEERKIKK